MNEPMNEHQGDQALQSILNLDRHLHQSVVLWFINMVLALMLLVYGVYKSETVISSDRLRDYVAVNTHDEIIELRHSNAAVERTLPLDDADEEILPLWVEESLIQCLTFDYQNYADVANFCTANIMSLNRVPDSTARRGQLFYRRLERSGIVPTLLENRTSMTVSIESMKAVDKGVESYTTIIENSDHEYESVKQQIYIYEYELVMRIQMVGQKLDAPIRYQVLVERMNPLVREFAVGIRSVVSLD